MLVKENVQDILFVTSFAAFGWWWYELNLDVARPRVDASLTRFKDSHENCGSEFNSGFL